MLRAFSYPCRAALPPPLEELPQQSGCLALPDAPIDLGRVVAGRLVEEPDAVVHAAALRIMGSVIDPSDAGEGDRPGAHGAGLQRHIEIAAGQPFVVEGLAGQADGEHLRMGGRVAQLARAVAGRGDDASVPDDGGSDRHLPAGGCGAGLREGHAHGIGLFWIECV